MLQAPLIFVADGVGLLVHLRPCGESHSKRIRYTKQAEKLENAIQRCVHNSIRLLERNIYYIISSISFVAIPNELEMATMQKVKTDTLF